MDSSKKLAKSHRRATHHALESDSIPPLWANQNGELNIDGVGKSEQSDREQAGQVERSGLLLPRSQRSRRKKPKPTFTQPSSSSSSSWRAQKSLDIISFNLGAELHFARWLVGELERSEFGAVSVGWVISNAAFELDVSIETVKRYLSKHTADRAEFHSDGKIITLRK